VQGAWNRENHKLSSALLLTDPPSTGPRPPAPPARPCQKRPTPAGERKVRSAARAADCPPHEAGPRRAVCARALRRALTAEYARQGRFTGAKGRRLHAGHPTTRGGMFASRGHRPRRRPRRWALGEPPHARARSSPGAIARARVLDDRRGHRARGPAWAGRAGPISVATAPSSRRARGRKAEQGAPPSSARGRSHPGAGGRAPDGRYGYRARGRDGGGRAGGRFQEREGNIEPAQAHRQDVGERSPQKR
jgi:hypothetical protein